MKQPETGTRHDLIEHRFRIAKEDLETAYLLLEAEQYRGANNRAYYSIYHTIDAILSMDGIYVASKEITIQQVETAERLFCLAKEYYTGKHEEIR